MKPTLRITRDLIHALREWNKAQLRARLAYYAGPSSWCRTERCDMPARTYCAHHTPGRRVRATR